MHYWVRKFSRFGLISEFGIVVASLGGGHGFKNGRQLAARAGLVPGQYSSDAKARRGGSPKPATPPEKSARHGRSVLAGLGDKHRFSRWARNLLERRGPNHTRMRPQTADGCSSMGSTIASIANESVLPNNIVWPNSYSQTETSGSLLIIRTRLDRP